MQNSGSNSKEYPPTYSINNKIIITERVEVDGLNLKEPAKVQLPRGGPSDKNEYIEYAMDMIAHNLIVSGQLNPSQAHLVKTGHLKQHIAKLVEKVEEAKRLGRVKQIASKTNTHVAGTRPRPRTSTPLAETSLPLAIEAYKAKQKPRTRPSTETRAKRSNILSIPVRSTPPTPASHSSVKNSRPRLPSPVSKIGSIRTKDNKLQFQSRTWTYRSPIGHRKMETQKNESRTSSPNSYHNHNVMLNKTEAIQAMDMEEGRKPILVEDSQGFGFQARLDMRGFENDEIVLNLKNRVLTVIGTRNERDGMPSRKTIETIEIPATVNLESLEVSRDEDGILIIQETLDFFVTPKLQSQSEEGQDRQKQKESDGELFTSFAN